MQEVQLKKQTNKIFYNINSYVGSHITKDKAKFFCNVITFFHFAK